MEGLYHVDEFRDFGPCGLSGDPGAPPNQRIHGKGPSQLRSQVRVLCPAKPGVYGMLDAAGELIYLGKAKLLRQRLLSYFRSGSRPPKAGRILRHAKAIVWEICAHEFAALLREQELIRRWRPRLNVQGQPLRRRLAFVCLGRAPAPYVYLTRQPPRDAMAVFGPVNWTERTTRAVQRVNDFFQLRDCPEPQEIIFPEQGGLFPLVRPAGCMRAELNTCLAPCTGSCTHDAYGTQTKAALQFLAGANQQPLVDLQRRMQAAASAQQFELAATLRDQQADFSWLAEHLDRLRSAQQELSFIYPLTGWDGAAHWYLIHGARVLACLPAPADPTTAQQVAAKIEGVYGRQNLAALLTPYEHHDGRLIVMQWFRQFSRERKKALSADEALAVARRPIIQSAHGTNR